MNLQEMFTPRNVMYGVIGATFIWALFYLALGLDVAHSSNPEADGAPPLPHDKPNG